MAGLGKAQRAAIEAMKAGNRVSAIGYLNATNCAIEDANGSVVGFVSWASMVSLENRGIVKHQYTERSRVNGEFVLVEVAQ